jgi:plastocyanin
MGKRIQNTAWRGRCAVLLSVLFFFIETQAATVTVHVGPTGNEMTFSPAEVSIAVGDTVDWVWESDFHSVSSGPPGQPSGDFDSDIQIVPFTFSHTFMAAGNFPYFCIVHEPMMVGTVHVFGTSTVHLAPLKDNTLYEDLTGQTSNGQGIYLFAGKTNVPTVRRGLIAFNLAAIPTNATVTDASLSMFLSQTSGGSDPVSLSTVARDWGEGASDAGDPGGAGIQAQSGDATWLHTFFNNVFWTTPGGDFSPTLSATTTVSTVNTTYMWGGSGLLTDVVGWVANPVSNFGWVILGNESAAGTAKRFNTRENSSNPPQLTITYQFLAPTATPTPTPPTGTPTPTPPTGTPTPTPTSSPTPTPPTSTPTPTTTPTPTPSPSATPTPAPSILGNISTRLRVEMGDNALIGGFIITGTQPKKVLVRAIGPSLSSFFPGVLADPILELRDSSGSLIASDDNWRTGGQEANILATGIPPSDDLESAIVATLPANNAQYTAIVRGVNNTTGIGVVEAYDLDRTVDSKLGNISTRGLVQTNDNVMIGGLIVLGQNPLRVIVRAIGPSLPLPEALADPTLELHDGNGALIAANDNWRTDQEAEIVATGIPPASDLESAIVRDFAPGNYTAIVRGTNNTTGVAVVEAYSLN